MAVRVQRRWWWRRMRELHHVGGRAGGEGGEVEGNKPARQRRRLEKRKEAELVQVEQFEVRIWCLY